MILPATLIAILLFSGSFLQADWLEELERAYSSNNIELLSSLLEKTEPENDIERAAELFFLAKTTVNREEVVHLLNKLTSDYPKERYGQLGFVELSNIALLERNYPLSLISLQRVTRDIVGDRDYLLASVYLKLGKYSDAISSAQDFILYTKDRGKKELAYLQIAEAYILDEKYEQAQLTLNTMVENKYAINHNPLIEYKIGYCHEHLSQTQQAIGKYRQIISQYPFTEYCYIAERRLYDLVLTNSTKVNYSELSTLESGVKEVKKTKNRDDEAKVVPTDGRYYLQVNAFSDKENALKHSELLRGYGFNNVTFPKMSGGNELTVVAVGPFPNQEDARVVQTTIKNKLNMDSFIITID